jgi:hypothetical protein
MRCAASRLLGAALLTGVLPASAAQLAVQFVEPEKYTDAGYSSSMPSTKEREQLQRDITQHLKQLADRALAEDDSLKIEVLDIDLAGHLDPFVSAGREMRIVRDATWPRIRLRHALTRKGTVVAEGEELVSDMNFLTPANRYSSSDRLRYEKAMLDDWFEKVFVKR